jgi:uncharacterized protein involved in exopolysaccharide biosynthesis
MAQPDHATSGPEVLRFLARQLRLLVAVTAGVTALVTALVYILPQRFASSALILVERGKHPTLRSDVLSYPLEVDEVVNSEAEIVVSRAVAETVVERLHLDTRARPWSRLRAFIERFEAALDATGLVTRLPRRERLISSIRRTLKVEPSARSNMLSITYFADDPHYAAEVARAVTDIYIELHGRIYKDNTLAFFESRVAETTEELNQVRQAVRRTTDRTELDALNLALRALESSYSFYREKVDRARADVAADSSLVNLRVVDYPAVPAAPRRSRLLFVALALVGGMLLALGIGLLHDYFDHAVHTTADLTRRLDLPVLGSVRRARVRAVKHMLPGS